MSSESRATPAHGQLMTPVEHDRGGHGVPPAHPSQRHAVALRPLLGASILARLPSRLPPAALRMGHRAG